MSTLAPDRLLVSAFGVDKKECVEGLREQVLAERQEGIRCHLRVWLRCRARCPPEYQGSRAGRV